MVERTVNTRQLEVLTWIVDGCPDAVLTGSSFKATAVAPQARRLVLVTKKRGIWRSEPTEAGRFFVENGRYPDHHWGTSISSPAHMAPHPVQLTSDRGFPARERKATGMRPVDQLIADVVAAGGRLEVEDGLGRFENLVLSARRFKKVPDGKLLVIERGQSWAERVIKLVDQPAWMTVVLEPIPVSKRLVRPHPAVGVLRADTEHRLRFKRDVRQRALRILDAIASEASRRGWHVACPTSGRHDQGSTADLSVTVDGHDHALRVLEIHDKVPHEPTAHELSRFEKWGYPRIPKYDKVPSGRLTMTIEGGQQVQQTSFNDTKTRSLVDQLPLLVQEIELRAAESAARRQQRERETAERQRHWEQVREQAVIDLRESSRAGVLAEHVARWHQHLQTSEYLTALRARVVEMTGEESLAASAWLDWADGHLERTNPLTQRHVLPPDPKPTAEAIKPFMRGLSPYGPEAIHGWR